MSKIPVLEIFGPTIQGEGMVIGQKTMFIRTAGCDYSCTWCDSAFTWDGSAKGQIRQMTSQEIWNELIAVGSDNFSHVTISGGNPVLLKNLGDLISLLKKKNIRIALETQGSIWRDWLLHVDEITLSPKPPSSNMKTNFEILSDILHKLQIKNCSLKIVVFNDEDFLYAKEIHKRYPNIPFFLQVGNDNIKLKDDTLLIKQLLAKYKWLIDKTLQCNEMNDVKVLPQIHTLIWGNKRGV
ncbi:7-carboxy-7-deazaguanine synthase QueE [Bacillus cereus]|uniref:7-carboxy-7-deazaguanine synthase n=1 Tax=Bacillus cereus TaxID=1396 RepID=A0A9X6WUB6_BACCE|nr:7-carboxy-7-deazaguanine synthase QueE [Bacillus cereus]PFK05224.1 7-carboxy-7-deazaguanine synthase QueE [Bacillus cereus]